MIDALIKDESGTPQSGGRMWQFVSDFNSGSNTFSLSLDDSILQLFSYFDCVVWSFIKCVGNKVAHLLAHPQSVEMSSVHIWDDDFPYFVVDVARSDPLPSFRIKCNKSTFSLFTLFTVTC